MNRTRSHITRHWASRLAVATRTAAAAAAAVRVAAFRPGPAAASAALRRRGRHALRAALVLALVGLGALPAAPPASAQVTLGQCDLALGQATNCAAAFGWQGYIDTDLQFSEFAGGDHTIMTRFMLQYPHAYQGPLLAVKGTGSYLIGQGDYLGGGAEGVKLVVNIGGSAAYYTPPPAAQALKPGQWQHLAVVRTGGWVKLYLNGAPLCKDGGGLFCDLALVGGSSSPSGTLRLGRKATGDAQFYGLLDDVAVFKQALTGAQIAALHTTVARLTGGESGLYAGYTFDQLTPSGGALPAKLGRPTSYQAPAKRAAVSQTRDGAADAERLPPPFQQAEMDLPFAWGDSWRVLWGWGVNTHLGTAHFTWDFQRAAAGGADEAGAGSGCGRPLYVSAPGKVTRAVDSGDTNPSDGDLKDGPNELHVEQAPGEIAVYMHVQTGSVSELGWKTGMQIPASAKLGEVGTQGPNNCHLHTGVDASNLQVTFPVAFRNYQVQYQCAGAWHFVARGVPATGDCVKRPYPFDERT